MVTPKRNFTPNPRQFCQRIGEFEAVAGFIIGQAQAADELVLHMSKRGFRFGAIVAVEHFERYAVLTQHFDILADAVELVLLAKELKRALRPLVVFDAGILAQIDEALTGIFGNAHHAGLVDLVAAVRAIGEHLQEPDILSRIAGQAQDERRMFLEQPFCRLERNAGRSQGEA